MTIKRTLYTLCLGTALFISSQPAAAQTVAELKPTGQWLVNSAGVAQAGGPFKSPCIMANQFNNGFILRISGGGEQLLSLSLDFRQNAFTQGQTYGAVLSVDGGSSYNLIGTAFTPGILIFGLNEAGGLYAAVQSGRSMALNVAGNTMIFSLDKAREGLQRLESCYSPPSMQSQTVQKVAQAAPKQNTEVYIKRDAYPEFKQPNAVDVLKADVKPVEQVSETQVASDVAAGKAGMPPLTSQEIASLELSPEDLKPYNPPAVKPMASGMSIPKVEATKLPAPQAVPVVEPQPVQMPSVQPVAKVTPTPITPVAPQQIAAVNPPPVTSVDAPRVSAATPTTSAALPAKAADQPTQWDAKAGEDIRIVLARWSERAGTDLVWEADGGGKVARDVNVTGNFEDAVKQVMADNAAAMGIRGQFADDDTMKPVLASANAPTPITPAASAPKAMPEGQWKAGKGDDLKTVLQAWAAQNDVDLKWESNEPFKLAQPVNETGDIASGLEAALAQFDEQAVRPVGQLNRDPKTGKLSLTIQTDRAS